MLRTRGRLKVLLCLSKWINGVAKSSAVGDSIDQYRGTACWGAVEVE